MGICESKEEPSKSSIEKTWGRNMNDKAQDMGPDSVNRRVTGHLEQQLAIHAKAKNRGVNIFAKSIGTSLLGEFTPPEFEKDEATASMIRESLFDNFIFSSLSEKELAIFVAAMEPVTVPADTVVISQGDVSDNAEEMHFFIVASGQVDFSIDGNNVGSCKAGGSFGELALLYNCKRAASCVTKSLCNLFRVDQVTFRYILAGSQRSSESAIIDVLQKIPIFADLDEVYYGKIADAMTEVSLSKGEQVIKKGDKGNTFYLIKSGEVKVSDIGTGESQFSDHLLKEKDFFGERSLLTGEARAATVTVSSHSATLLALSKEFFDETLGPLEGIIGQLVIKRILTSVPVFASSQLESYETDELLRKTRLTTFDRGAVIQEQSERVKESLFMIMKGSVTVSHTNGIIAVLKSGDYFGAENLEMDAAMTVERSKTMVVASPTIGAVCAELTRLSVLDVIRDLSRLGKPISPVHTKLDTTIKFEDLKKHKILGMGTFGRVWLVTSRKTKKPYALKVLEKQQILKHDQHKGVIREKNIMASLNHPLIVNLLNTYKDADHCFMLIELILGGELFSILHTNTHDGVSVENSIFYSACILSSLIYMHERKICYRDLKPENVMIDADGYCVVVDLGFAKIVPNKTYTLCGTPEYLAPEIILSKGHDKAVDIWAFGIILYEMIYGQSPFYSRGIDQVAMFRRIVNGRFTFPEGGRGSSEARDIISKLIVRKAIERIGCNATHEADIFLHPFYDGVTIGKITRKEFVAPWTPAIRDPTDTSNFDSYEGEEMRERKLKKLTAEQDLLFRDF